MHTEHVYKFLTHAWAPGYSHLEESKLVGTIKLTPHKRTQRGNHYDEGDSFTQHGRIPKGVNKRELAKAIVDTMSGSRCQHEYDCCGCATTRVEVKLLPKRRIFVHTAVSYNY